MVCNPRRQPRRCRGMQCRLETRRWQSSHRQWQVENDTGENREQIRTARRTGLGRRLCNHRQSRSRTSYSSRSWSVNTSGDRRIAFGASHGTDLARKRCTGHCPITTRWHPAQVGRRSGRLATSRSIVCRS